MASNYVYTAEVRRTMPRLELTFGVSGTALNWLASYLSGRDYFVRIGADSPEVLHADANWCTTRVRSGSAILHFVHCVFD